MNYFERLVRRALTAPATAPGAALIDPFDTVAEWPLDPPVLPSVTPASPPVVAVPADGRVEERLVERTLPAPVVPPPPVFAAAPVPSGESTDDPSRQAVDSERSADAPPRPATLLEVTAPPAPERPMLERADAFMQSLGVRVPDAAVAPPPAPLLPPRASHDPVAPHMAGPAVRAPRAQVVPPPSPRRPADTLKPARRTVEAPAPHPPTPDDTPGRPGATTALRALDSPRLLVIERRLGVAQESAMGGGAPHFGLGQL